MNDNLIIVDQDANFYTIGGKNATNIHNELTGRGNPGAHPMEAITSLGRYEDVRKRSELAIQTAVEALNYRLAMSDTKEEHMLYLDSNDTTGPMSDLTGNRSIFHKYTTVADLITSSRWVDQDNVTVTFTAETDVSDESFIIDSQNGITLYTPAGPDVENVWVGSLYLAGTTDNFSGLGLSFDDTVTLGSNGEYAVFQSCNFLKQVVAVASGIPTDIEMVRSFEKCRFMDDLTLNGEAVVEYGFYDCWSYVKTNGTWPTLTVNNPNATVILDGTTALKMEVIIVDCARFEMNGVSINSLNVGGSGNVVLKTGTVCDPDNEAILRPINLSNAGTYSLGTVVHSRTGSIYGLHFSSSGIGTLQVRENGTRTGYTPRIDPADGTHRVPGQDTANTIKDHFNGISDAIEAAVSGMVGIADGGISDDGTKINFYPDKINKGDEYALFQMPLSSFSNFTADESSIHLGSNVFSAITTSGPIFDAIETREPKVTGKGLSANDYVADDKAKLTALASINSVTNNNGLTLSAGTLAFTSQRGRVNLSSSCNGSLTIFNGTFTHSTIAMVFLNGLKLCNGTNYTITDSQLTLTTTAPPAGSILEVELF
jgi:hypothetical protein